MILSLRQLEINAITKEEVLTSFMRQAETTPSTSRIGLAHGGSESKVKESKTGN